MHLEMRSTGFKLRGMWMYMHYILILSPRDFHVDAVQQCSFRLYSPWPMAPNDSKHYTTLYTWRPRPHPPQTSAKPTSALRPTITSIYPSILTYPSTPPPLHPPPLHQSPNPLSLHKNSQRSYNNPSDEFPHVRYGIHIRKGYSIQWIDAPRFSRVDR